MKAYPVLQSTLEGIFGSGVGHNDYEATSNLLRDLDYEPFRNALKAELDAALIDVDISWKLLLEECGVAYFDSDDEARKFVVERIQEPSKSYPTA